MNRRQWLSGCALLALAGVVRPGRVGAEPPVPPVVPKHPRRIEQLGRVRIDDYAWLKPDNWPEVWRSPATLDPAIRACLANEAHYADVILGADNALEELLHAEMIRRSSPELPVLPQTDGPWEYRTDFANGAQHPRYVRRPVGGGIVELLLDVSARAEGKAFLHVANPCHSPDHRYFIWAEDEIGAEKYRIVVKDLTRGAIVENGPQDAFGDFTISADSAWLFWTWRDPHSRPARIYRRPIGGGPDVLVYEEPDPAFLLQVSRTASHAYVTLRCWNDVTSEVWVIPAADPLAMPRVIAPRETGLLYSVEHWNDRFVILTNADGAVDFKLMVAEPGNPGRADWRELVPHAPGQMITELRAFRDYLVRISRIEGNPALIVRDRVAGHERRIDFSEAAYALALEPGDFAGHRIDVRFSSPRCPSEWIRIDLATGKRRRRARQYVDAAFDSDRYVLERRHAVTADGASVPITLLRRKSSPAGLPAPLLLTGYGSYGYSYETGFSVPVLSLVDRGWVWAVAHVRGGAEKGRDWFEQARTFDKKRSFTDFIACAEHLIAAGLTASGRIAIHGYSAGGLLVGVAANMRPDLWGAVIGQAPFVDMLNTMSDAKHPLVPLTRPVWGDPLSDPEAYDYIASYSPYENVERRAYPAVLATTAIGDDRVGFWEPAKWIARLREQNMSGQPMLLHVDMSGGHGGASGRFAELRLHARIYAFAISRISGG